MKSPGHAILKVSFFLLGMALLSLAYASLAFLFRGETLVEVQTGESGTFELKEPGRLILVDDNTTGLGRIRQDDGVHLLDPDGQECRFDSRGEDMRGAVIGVYDLKKTGAYQFELGGNGDKIAGRGALRTQDKLPGLGTAVWSGLACGLLALPFAALGKLALLFSPKKEPSQE